MGAEDPNKEVPMPMMGGSMGTVGSMGSMGMGMGFMPGFMQMNGNAAVAKSAARPSPLLGLL